VWKAGSISGLKARGGFEVNMQWQNGEIAKATIKSSLGGNCRIRSYSPLKGKGLKVAKGENPNSFYPVTEILPVLNHSTVPAAAIDLKKVYEYDVMTKKGQTIEVSK